MQPLLEPVATRLAAPVPRLPTERAARRIFMKTQAALLQAELQRLDRRRRTLDALWRFLRAVEPYDCPDRFGAFDSLRIFLIALTETRAARRRRHERMSAIARKAIAVGKATETACRSLAQLRAAWMLEFHDPPPGPLQVEWPESERSAVW